MKYLSILLLLIGVSFNTSAQSQVADSDGNVYPVKWMKDGKLWMTKNLNVKTANSFCYNNKEKLCQKYGRLYTWKAAKEACALLGPDWYLPTNSEWRALAIEYGGYFDRNRYENIGDPTVSFNNLVGKGSESFNAMLGGYRTPFGNSGNLGSYGDYWSGTEVGNRYALFFGFFRENKEEVMYHDQWEKNWAFAVRCVQDVLN